MRKTSPGPISCVHPSPAGSVTSKSAVAGIARALHQAGAHAVTSPISFRYAAVSAKPRPFSGRDSRQGSSAAAGGPSLITSSTGGGP